MENNPAQVLELISYVQKIYEQGELEPFISLVQAPNRILLYLSKTQNAHPSELSENLGISRPSVANHLKLLEQKNYIERQTNPDNRRETYVSLTKEGKAYFQKIIGLMLDMFNEWIELLGEETVHLFRILNISSKTGEFSEKFKSTVEELKVLTVDETSEE